MTDPAPITRRARSADELRRRHHVTESGRPDAPPLVFAHGYATNQEVWRHVAPAFDDEFRVIRFDHIGSGGSDRGAWDPARHRSLEGFAEDVVELVEGLGLHGVTFVGHSVSAMIGALAVTMAPHRFTRLVMVAASARYIDDDGYVGGFTRAQIDAVLDQLDSDYEGWARAMAPRLVGAADPAVAEELEAMMLASSDGHPATMARSFLLGDYRAQLAEVPVPTLVMQGSEDPFVPLAVGRFVEEQLTEGHFVQLATSGHFPSLTGPAEVIAAIRAFV